MDLLDMPVKMEGSSPQRRVFVVVVAAGSPVKCVHRHEVTCARTMSGGFLSYDTDLKIRRVHVLYFRRSSATEQIYRTSDYVVWLVQTVFFRKVFGVKEG